MAELTACIAISWRLDVGKELPETVGLSSNRVEVLRGTGGSPAWT